MQWHATTREQLVREGANDNFHPKWGRFVPSQRFNVEQSPLPFAMDVKRIYEHSEKGNPENRTKKVWISQPQSGLDKRQCSLQVCFRPEDTQPRIAIIFKGRGKRISTVERESWDPDVDVLFQKKAWAVSIEWLCLTLAQVVQNLDRFVLLCDNQAHRHPKNSNKKLCQ